MRALATCGQRSSADLATLVLDRHLTPLAEDDRDQLVQAMADLVVAFLEGEPEAHQPAQEAHSQPAATAPATRLATPAPPR